jgi:hypothetical protein
MRSPLRCPGAGRVRLDCSEPFVHDALKGLWLLPIQRGNSLPGANDKGTPAARRARKARGLP